MRRARGDAIGNSLFCFSSEQNKNTVKNAKFILCSIAQHFVRKNYGKIKMSHCVTTLTTLLIHNINESVC